MPDCGQGYAGPMTLWIASSWSTHTASSEGWRVSVGGQKLSLREATMESRGRWEGKKMLVNDPVNNLMALLSSILNKTLYKSMFFSFFLLLFVSKEIEFMYKPGNRSAPPPVLTPHQPRLDWQMWFAALGDNTQAPWFTSLMYRLLQGKRDGVHLL